MKGHSLPGPNQRKSPAKVVFSPKLMKTEGDPNDPLTKAQKHWKMGLGAILGGAILMNPKMLTKPIKQGISSPSPAKGKSSLAAGTRTIDWGAAGSVARSVALTGGLGMMMMKGLQMQMGGAKKKPQEKKEGNGNGNGSKE
tara:strand:+ start:218 stop:640 length:423 start_codon:yes stop_codon:yes gene_type:complete